jgi:hypothetical protein
MKLTTGILAAVMMTGAAWGQNPDAIDNARSVAKSLTQIKTNESNAALAASSGVPAQASKPAAGAPAPAVKPAAIPGAKPAEASKPASAPAAKPAKADSAKAAAVPASSSKTNLLDKVSVVHKADDVQIEISPREAVTPKVSKLSSPARVVVELPATTMATAQSKIVVGSAGVKGVRIGMDGKIPPTTSVVVDLEQAFAYDVTPGPGNKLVLTLHTQAVAKNVPAATPAQTTAPAAKLQTASAKPVTAPAAAVKDSTPATKTQAAVAKPAVVAAPVKSAPAPVVVAKSTLAPAVQPKATPIPAKTTPAAATTVAKDQKSAVPQKAAPTPILTAKADAPKPAAKPSAPATTKIAAHEELTVVSKTAEAPKSAQANKPVEAPKPEPKKWAMNGKRDPFFSPVVQQAGGSGCSNGKKCLEIGQINVRGVVKSENGFIAVVTNSLNKAYFLHENDPVFNGYVLKITGDAVVFQETFQDKLGKPLTREIVKKITTPAV